jgi:uncharacterized protein (TIGR00369 family)
LTDTNDTKSEMTGLEQLQSLVATGKRPGIAVSLDFDLVELGDGIAVFSGIPGDHAYNPINAIHGGYAATLLDSACGCAVHTKLSASQLYTTLELKVSYLRGMTRDTGRVRAEGKVISFGRRAAFAEAKLVGEDGTVFATATSTLLIMDRPNRSPK